MKIVVEGSHTPSGTLTARTFENLGAEVVVLNEDIQEVSGMHKADPSIRSNLKELEEAIKSSGSDLGIAFDLDGDRGAIHVPIISDITLDTRFESLAPDNLITILLTSLKDYWGYSIEGKRYGVIRDVLGTYGVNDRAKELGVEFFQTDAGYVFLKAKKEKMEKEGFVFPIYGERSGHTWLHVSGEIENPLAVGVLFSVLVMKEKKAFFNKRNQHADMSGERKNPVLDMTWEKRVHYSQSPRFQPFFHPGLLKMLSEDKRNTIGWNYNKESKENPPQSIIELGKDVSIRMLKQEFTLGKTYNTPAGTLTVKEFNDYLDDEDGLYRFADIMFEIDGKFAGRFVFRASSNDPSFVTSYESPLAFNKEKGRPEKGSFKSAQVINESIVGIVFDFLISKDLAIVTQEQMQALFPELLPADIISKFEQANLTFVERDYLHYKDGKNINSQFQTDEMNFSDEEQDLKKGEGVTGSSSVEEVVGKLIEDLDVLVKDFTLKLKESDSQEFGPDQQKQLKEISGKIVSVLSEKLALLDDRYADVRRSIDTLGNAINPVDGFLGISSKPEYSNKIRTGFDKFVKSLEDLKSGRLVNEEILSKKNNSSPVGGINLDPQLLDLQIKRDGNGVPLPLPLQPIQDMHIEGFIPVIINVTPVTNLPLLLGIGNDGQGSEKEGDLSYFFDLDPFIKELVS